jgi:metacaspase-1
MIQLHQLNKCSIRALQAFSGSTSTGAMTYSFIKAVESAPGTTYGRLLTAMRATIRDNGGIPGPIGTFFRRAITFSCAQVLTYMLLQ